MPGKRNENGPDESVWKREPNVHELRKSLADFESDPERAIPGLKSLAERGSMVSMVALGEAYARRLPKSDLEMAKYWYIRADELGSSEAAFMLGRILAMDGDARGAFEYYRRSNDRGYLPAVYRLGKLYATGDGVVKDLNKARELWEYAAGRGHLFAKGDLSRLYLSGAFGLFATLRGLMLFASGIKDLLVSGILGLLRGDPLDERMMG